MWIHMLGHQLIYHLNFILLQTPRSDCKDSHAWRATYMFIYILFCCKPPDQTARFTCWMPAHISLTFCSTADTQIGLWMHMLGHQHIFHLHFILLQTPRSDSKNSHAWTPAFISYFILLKSPRSDKVDARAWTPAHISLRYYSTANILIRLQGFTCLGSNSYFTYILFF